MMTSTNLDKNIKIVFSVFKRFKNQIQPYEAKALENVLNQIKDTENSVLNGFPLIEKMTALLMFHFTIAYGNPKTASFMLKKNLGSNAPLSLINSSLQSVILEQFLSDLFKNEDTRYASKGRIRELTKKIHESWTLEDVAKSVKKTALDLIIINDE